MVILRHSYTCLHLLHKILWYAPTRTAPVNNDSPFKNIPDESTLDIVSPAHDVETFFDSDPSPLKDNEYWGHYLGDKKKQSIRIYYQNIHGITSDNTWDKWERSVVSMHNKNIDVCCFAETNIK